MYCQIRTNVVVDPAIIPATEGELIFTESQKYGATMKDVTPNPIKLATFKTEDKRQLLSLLPQKLVLLEVPDVVMLSMQGLLVEQPSVTAHIDYNRRCALNFYLQANGETTKYYKWDRSNKQLIEVGMFCAKTNEWWLMDTTKPHAVMLVPNEHRTVLSYSFQKTSFAKVQQFLEGGS
jgi:hypothetical protein